MTTLINEIPDAIIDILEADSAFNSVLLFLDDPYPFIPLEKYPLVEVVTTSEGELDARQQTGTRTRTLSGYIRVTTIGRGEIVFSSRRGTVAAARTCKELVFNIVNVLGKTANKNLNNPVLSNGRVVDLFTVSGDTEYLDENTTQGYIYQGLIVWSCDVTENRT